MTPPYPRTSPDEMGRRGLRYLDRYENDGDDGALSTGIALLEDAVAAVPAHPDRLRWWYGLGRGYECRAERDGSVDDYDRALGWYTRLDVELPARDVGRAAVALLAAGACWSRYWLRRYRGPELPEDPAGLVEELLGGLRRWPPPRFGHEPFPRLEADVIAHPGAYLRMIWGLAHQERYDVIGSRPDLDTAIDLLSGALPALPDDAPWLPVAAFALANAYRERYAERACPVTLDLAIVAGERAIGLTPADGPTGCSAREHQALCLAERWRSAGDRADLDRAIEAWRAVLAWATDGWPAAVAGELLRERAELDRDPGAAAEAVRLLDRSTGEPTDDQTAAKRWLALGRAHRTQWSVGGADGALDAAKACFVRVLALLPDGTGPVAEAAALDLRALTGNAHHTFVTGRPAGGVTATGEDRPGDSG